MRDGNFDPGPMPKMDWLPVDKLTADARFQRSIESRRSQSNIKNIVERFTWSLFQVATVANVDGTFSIIDGQHRVEAARQIGLETVPCIVIEVENVAEAARLFVDANRNRVTLTPQAIHKALVAAGDEQACAVDRAASAAGIEILPYPIQGVHMRPGQTLAVGTIRNLVREVGEATATEVLAIVSGCWSDPGGIRAERIKAVAFAVVRHDLAPVQKALSLPGAGERVERHLYGVDLPGMPRWRRIADGITDEIDGGKPQLRKASAAADDTHDDGGEMFAKPVRRRCVCNTIFETRNPRQMMCEKCRQVAGA